MIALGTLSIGIGVLAILGAALLYWMAMIRTMRGAPSQEETPATEDAALSRRRRSVPRNGGNGHRRHSKRAARQAPAERALLWARRLFFVSVGCSLIAAGVLLALTLGRHYEVAYVYEHTNNSLPSAYRFAAFWAGQEGTFVLWAFYGSLFGLLLLWKARAEERWLMPFFCVAQAFVFATMVVMGPFRPHPLDDRSLLQAMAGEGLPIPRGLLQTLGYYVGLMPLLSLQDGHGLNDLLQNPWMVIHPPTLFLGYTSMLVPACFALGALMKRDYDTWVHRAAPWLAFSWMVLAAGVFLGGYWAYETLGWGGYWAWDPVENSSLLPWLVGTALLHGVLAQRVRRNFKQANLLLGILAYAAVLYGSFLTRSGVLDGVSVHAFVSPGWSVFTALLIFQIVWLGIGLPIWIWRFKDIDSEAAYENAWERSFGFFLGLIVLCSVTAIVVLGVSWPMISGLFGKRASMPQSFYDRAILPVALVMLLLMAITPYAPWRHARRECGSMKPAAKAILIAAAALLLAFLPAAFLAWRGGWTDNNGPLLLVFAIAAAVCLAANLGMLVRTARAGIWNTGPWVCHIGYAILLIGVVVSTFYGKDDPSPDGLVLQHGESQTRFGYQITYKGLQTAETPYEKDRILLEAKRGDQVAYLRAPYYFSETMGDYVKWPAILHQWWGDLQISTAAHDTGTLKVEEVKLGQTSTPQSAQYYVNDPPRRVSIRLDHLEGPFPLPEMEGWLAFRARCTAIIDGKEHRNLTVMTAMNRDMEFRPMPTPLPGFPSMRHSLLMTRVAPSLNEAQFEVAPAEPKDIVALGVMYRPGVNIVWLGGYLLIAGGFICYRRRAQLAARPPAPNPKSFGGEKAVRTAGSKARERDSVGV
ncbi:MAG: cytochrome c biogenesis protein CcsA [Armatimonadetes bacterium]|nr:cytochrome c biogenesis protein CcsA [Armatimonadota bacterium]